MKKISASSPEYRVLPFQSGELLKLFQNQASEIFAGLLEFNPGNISFLSGLKIILRIFRAGRLRSLIIFVFVTLVLIGLGRADVVHKRYLVKSGIIEYTITGHQPGRALVYFDDWGDSDKNFMKDIRG